MSKKKKSAVFGGSKRGSVSARGKCVGDNYPADRFNNPVAAGMGGVYGEHDEKTVYSDTAETTFEPGLPMHKSYDSYWEGK